MSGSSWRDVLPVHPAADLFPRMSEPELRELGEDIKKNGLQVPIVAWISREDRDHPGRYREPKRYSLLDGRNRLDAMELVGIPFKLSWHKEYLWILEDRDNEYVDVQSGDPYEFVISANIRRRHLSAEDKRDLIAKLLKARPGKSDRQIAVATKVDHKTVAKVRREEEGRGEIPHAETRTDTKGREQPAKKPEKQRPPEPTPTQSEEQQYFQQSLYDQACVFVRQMNAETGQRLLDYLQRRCA